MGFFKKAFKSAAAFNPITATADVLTGGKLSDVTGMNMGYGTLEDIGSGLQQGYEDISGQTAAEATEAGARTQAEAMMRQLEYYKEINKLPQQYKGEALTRMSDIAAGGAGQTKAIEEAKASPLYAAIMGGQKAGEESILRHAGATGGLRSGNVQSNLAEFGANLSNQALLESYNQNLGLNRSLAGIPTNEQMIGQTMGNIGATRAAGITGAAQARQQGLQNLLNTGLMGASMFI